ncbi:N-acetylmuramoyl-L-alanine amidase [Halobacillus hunanensis]|uniref:N-acetylmuramoyl-L-alanine amidase n=1 Tax=Halobacillus hunanensis TaxID=578214 RepID=UPI0011168CC8|nr:N-acetylmuramoyl-L-alanine amidase [Halobacillus hunanensis]
MRKSSFTLLVACLSFMMLFTFLTPKVAAEEGTTYRVEATNLNVRSGPGLESSVIGSLDDQALVTVYEHRYGWARINYDGQVGWVAGYYLVETDSNSSQGGQVSVSVDAAHLRTGPGTGHDSLGLVYRGDTFTVIEKSNDWVQVQVSGGSGWIAGWLLTSGSSSEPPSSSSLEGINVVLDAGHGGYDPGAIGYYDGHEKNMTLPTAQVVSEQLEQAGATVIMTRSSDRYLSLEERVSISNDYNTHAFISLHYNSSIYSSARGISTYYYSDADKGLADQIQDQLVAHTGLQNDGVRFGDFHVLRENSDTSVLVELGFISNPIEVEKLKTASYKANVAEAITQGLMDYF